MSPKNQRCPLNVADVFTKVYVTVDASAGSENLAAINPAHKAVPIQSLDAFMNPPLS